MNVEDAVEIFQGAIDKMPLARELEENGNATSPKTGEVVIFNPQVFICLLL
jgi:hypothetical protein